MNRPHALTAIDSVLCPIAVAMAQIGSACFRVRQPGSRPLIIRPGGMGDLILLCIAAEELGFNIQSFVWLIEERSSAWAKHLGLDYICYDRGFLFQHWKIAGRFRTVINSEQLYGLSQASAKLACGRDSSLTSFSTNRASEVANIRVNYDPDDLHETVAFKMLLAAALHSQQIIPQEPVRRLRKNSVSEKPIVGIAGTKSESRALTEEQWRRFIHSFIGPNPFWIAASPADLSFAERLCARFEDQAEIFGGGFTDLCNLISRSSEVLTVDGGFMHIASYYGVPLTAVFTSGRDRKWAPLSAGSRMVRRSDLKCQPCTRFGATPQCRHQFACKELDFDRHVSEVI